MKKHRTAAALATSIFLAGAMLLPSGASFAQAPAYNTNPTIEDIGPKLRAESLADAQAAGKIDLSGASDASVSTAPIAPLTQADVGTVKKWLTHNDFTGRYVLTDFKLRAVGQYGEVWVATNLNYLVNDPRNAMVEITDSQVNYLLNEFDTNMYAKEVEFFGAPAERTGQNGFNGWYKDDSGRVVILVDNIKDQSYYTPNYPSYIAGYFSSTISDFVDRNVMTIDAFDWKNRMGANAARPFQYEGTFAHEFQHLLHRDTDNGEETFINEGLSDFAQYLVGYGHSTSHVNFFMQNPRNSLTTWSDQSDLQILGDYGTAYLFQLYLYERFGEAFMQQEFRNPKHGIDSINDTLQKIGANTTFQQVYADYMTALMLDGKYQGDNNTFHFKSIDVSPNVEAASKLDNMTPVWGTTFRTIVPDKKIDHLYFKGLDFLRTNWATASDATKGTVLWGHNGDEIDNHLIRELDLTGQSQATLTFDTKYDIEEQWDFGLVQISTDGGKSWKSLNNGDTRSDIVDQGYPKIKENLPGFTGSSNGWKTESFDLSQYAGQKVLLSFRYMTDWGSNEAGWYISNLRLNNQTIDPLTSTAGFKSLEQVTDDYVDYQVQFIGYKKGNANGNDNHVKVIRFNDLLNMKESDRIDLGNMLHSSQFEKVVMMVTYTTDSGKGGSVPFEYEVVNKSSNNKTK
jgi:immune inhibitor A